MKRKIKNACIIIGLGGALILIGMMMGGGIKKTVYKTLNHVLYGYTNEHFYGYADGGWSMDDEVCSTTLLPDIPETELVPDISGIAQLKVDISHATLKIEPHDKRSISYSIVRNTKKLAASVNVQGNILKIETKKIKEGTGNWLFGWHRDRFKNTNTVITVKLPHDMIFESAHISAGATLLFLDGFTARDKFTLLTGAGVVEVNNITASHVNIETGVGKTMFQNCTFTDTTMQTGVGETSFDGKLFKNFDIETGIGKTNIRIDGKRSDYSIDITSGIGAVLVNGAASSGVMGANIKESNQHTAHTIYVKAGIGAIELNFTE